MAERSATPVDWAGRPQYSRYFVIWFVTSKITVLCGIADAIVVIGSTSAVRAAGGVTAKPPLGACSHAQ